MMRPLAGEATPSRERQMAELWNYALQLWSAGKSLTPSPPGVARKNKSRSARELLCLPLKTLYTWGTQDINFPPDFQELGSFFIRKHRRLGWIYP